MTRTLSIIVLMIIILTILALMLYKYIPQTKQGVTSVKNNTSITTKIEEIKTNTTKQESLTITGKKTSSNITLLIVVDNNPDPSGKLGSGWGLSILVRTGQGLILFDTGPDPKLLEHNLAILGIDPKDIKAIVISHAHGDHTGGLPYVLKHHPGIPVYIPAGSSKYLEEYILRYEGVPIAVNDTRMIMKGVYILGQLYGPPWEQALVVDSDKGYILLVGCSHPGIVRIVEELIHDLGKPPYMVIGGFHMSGAPVTECREVIEELISLGVEKIAPIHCSGNTIRELLRKYYPDHYLPAHTGSVIEI